MVRSRDQRPGESPEARRTRLLADLEKSRAERGFPPAAAAAVLPPIEVRPRPLSTPLKPGAVLHPVFTNAEVVPAEVAARTADMGDHAVAEGTVILSGLDDMSASALADPAGVVVVVGGVRYASRGDVYWHPVHGWKVFLVPAKEEG